MKKSFIAFALMSLFSLNAFAEFSLTCPQMYALTVQKKHRGKKKLSHLSDDLATAAFVTSFGGSAPFTLGLILPAVTLNIIAGAKPREEKVLDLSEEGTRRLASLAKKARKKISKDITEEEIAEIVQQGLSDGTYCQDFPDLYSPGDVKDHVFWKLRNKYPALKN